MNRVANRRETVGAQIHQYAVVDYLGVSDHCFVIGYRRAGRPSWWTSSRTGAPYNVCDGILRARFRNSFEAPVAVTPGEPHHVEIDLGPTSLVFGRGHRIRLHVSSSNFPAHARNLNTGGVNADEFEPVVAYQTLLHDPDHPSHLRLPARWR